MKNKKETTQTLNNLISIKKMPGYYEGQYQSGHLLRFSCISEKIFRLQIMAADQSEASTSGTLEHTNKVTSEFFAQSEILETNDNYRLLFGRYTFIFKKFPAGFAIYDEHKRRFILQEADSLALTDSSALETLKQEPNEFYFGTGPNTAQFSHKGHVIEVAAANDELAQSIPFFWSNSGYGLLRNTEAAGEYDFGTLDKTRTLIEHEDANFDNFYLLGDTPTDILQQYYYLTGNPVLVPRFANFVAQQIPENANTTDLIAQYQKADVPLGSVIQHSLQDLTETTTIAQGISSTSPAVLNKAVTTPEIKMLQLEPTATEQLSFTELSELYQEFLTKHPNTRPYFLFTKQSAGTQRFSASFLPLQGVDPYQQIKNQLPAMIGSGLSGQPNIGADFVTTTDPEAPEAAIFDLSWKTFSPLDLSAAAGFLDYGRKATQINRAYLKLKSELAPYHTSLAHQAINAKPMMRAMFLEFPHDRLAYTKFTQNQYMFGPYFLVAPIYMNHTNGAGDSIRNNIYLPDKRTTWIDFLTGEKYLGGMVYENLIFEHWHLPVFVKAGAIIPLTKAHNNPAARNSDVRFFTLYPSGRNSLEVIDDDGISKNYLRKKTARTKIISDLTNNILNVEIRKTLGGYHNFQKEQATILNILCDQLPTAISIKMNGQDLPIERADSQLEFEQKDTSYLIDANFHSSEYFEILNNRKNQQLALKIKLPTVDITANGFEIVLKNFYYDRAKTDTKIIDSALQVPKSFKIDKARTTNDSLTLTWQQINPAEKYEILVNDLLHTNIRANHFTFTELDPSTNYQFRIRSTIKNKVSDWSSLVYAQTKNDR